jgi:vacuolar-type H+-ATPase subunit C/Vma6
MKNVIDSNARAKSLEKDLLSKERLIKMIEAPSTESAFKILTEAGFGEGVHLDLNSSFEKPMLIEESKLKAFIKEVCPIEDVKKYFLIVHIFI